MTLKVVNKSNQLDKIYHPQKKLQPMYGGTVNNPQNIYVKKITIDNKFLEIYGAFCNKMTLHNFWLSTDDPGTVFKLSHLKT